MTTAAAPVSSAASARPVVLIAEELSPATIEALGPDFDVRRADGADRAELLPAIADVDAVLIRSATRLDAEAIAAASKLKVIARAGVGLDNVDVAAATRAGVMVVNAPTSNIISAAELTVGHILSLARNIPQANASLKGGAWKRSAYAGVELFEKMMPDYMAVLDSNMVARDQAGVVEEAHKIKGAAGSIGLRRLQQTAQLIQSPDHPAWWENVEDWIETLRREYPGDIARLRRWLLS